MSSKRIVIVGAGGHAVSVAEAARSAGFQIAAFSSDNPEADAFSGTPVVREIPPDHLNTGGLIALAIGDNFLRQQVWDRLVDVIPHDRFPTICHTSAIVAPDAELSPAVVVLQGAIVASGATVRTGALINTGAILDHESSLSDFASLAPGATTGGRVSIGPRSAISIGAVVRHGVSIGADTVVGAASYVHRDLASGVVAYGAPARVIRKRVASDPYLG